jgi:Cu/Zn superoxide dismutase
MNFDGYINVHLSEANLGTIVAQGDIGGNELTGNKKDYTLNPVAVPSIAGTASFEERKNGNTLITLRLSTPGGGSHPAHIHFNSAAEGGGIAIDLANVDGNTGLSVKNVKTLNSGTKITYSELLNYDGYINVHESAANLGTLVAQGDIGGNELTGQSKIYPLLQKDGSGVSGNAKFEKRKNGNTLITLTLSGTPAGGIHPAHIHQNSAAEGGPIVVSLKDVDGNTGKSLTNVEKFDGASGAAVTYDELIAYDGYINVHLSAAQLGIIVAQGNVGSNAP